MLTAAEVPVWGWVLVAVGAAVVVVAVASWATSERRFPMAGKVVVITGGSSGIGRAAAKAVLARGGHVALLARKAALLSEAVEALTPARRSASQRITTHVVDVCDDAATAAGMAAVAAAHGGVIDAVINSAGTSLPKVFEETSAEEWTALLRLNVVGTRNATAAALRYMTAPSGGRIVFVSSQAGQVGVYGYTAYSATKFALQGFAQALQQEVWTRGIRVSLSFPPDTDTPLLAEENKAKPRVTRLLSESTATAPADVVGAGLIDGLEAWRPLIAVGFDGWMLATATSGMGPAGSLAAAVVQVATMGLWRMVALFVLQGFYATIAKHDARPPSGATPATPAAATPLLAAAAAVGGGAPAGAAKPAVAAPVAAEDKRK